MRSSWTSKWVDDLETGIGFYIADDGNGLPDERAKRVLEADSTSSEAGSGFGLAIVKQIAGAHGWELSLVESHEGGARYEFRDARSSNRRPPSDLDTNDRRTDESECGVR